MSEEEMVKIQALVLCTRDAHDEAASCETEDGEGLVLLHDRLVKAAAEIKATTTSSRNQKKFCVPEEIRQMASNAAKCRDPVRRRHLRKIALKSRREFEAEKAVLPRGKVINRPVITNLWVNGRASEDGDEWTEEVGAHCERCYDDKEETSEVQAEKIPSQRRRRDHCVAPEGRRLPSDGNAAVSPDGNCVRGSTLVRQAFPKRAPCPGGVESSTPRVPQKPDAKLEKGLRGFRAIALLSVFSNWYTTVLVDMLHEEKEPSEWKRMHVGAERGVNCELERSMRSWWRDNNIYRSKIVPMATAYSTVLNRSVDWPWSGAMTIKFRAWESQI